MSSCFNYCPINIKYQLQYWYLKNCPFVFFISFKPIAPLPLMLKPGLL